ncbi:MAG: hypothetical protein JSW61_08125 [Candidatus Thorarchaeota archaeon]|nr:MAG: hypothetical protein JSW61_08125 [Candidatus Thorarchaeota archaeon]
MERRRATVILLVVWLVFTFVGLLGFLSPIDDRVLVVVWIALLLAISVCRCQAYEAHTKGLE